MLNWRRVNHSLCVMGVIALMLVVLAGTGVAQNVFPLTLSGQDKIYLDTNKSGAPDAEDGYFTVTLVTLQDAGDDSGKWAVIAEGHNGLGYGTPAGKYVNIFALDGDRDGDGKFHLHEIAEDVTYLGNDGNPVGVECVWAHVSDPDDENAMDHFSGYVHSLVMEMSDPANPFAGFNRFTAVIESGLTEGLDDNDHQNEITIEYNDGNFADTFSFSEDALMGNILMDFEHTLSYNSTEYYPNADNPTHVKQEGIIFGTDGYDQAFAFIPLDENGSLEISDGRPDGFYLRSSVKPVPADPDDAPFRMPEEGNGGDDEGDDDDDGGDDGETPATTSSNSDNFPPHCMITTMAQTTAPLGHLWLVLLGLLGVGGSYLVRRK